IGLFRPLGTPLFAWSGANPTFAERVRGAGIVDVGYDAASDQFHRAGDRRAPHSPMLSSAAEMWAANYPGATVPGPLFTYRAANEQVTGGTPITGVHIVFAEGAGSWAGGCRGGGARWARS